jgi:type I restriction enzyme S subunit
MARITPCLENGKIARFRAKEGARVGHDSTEFIVIRGRDGVTATDYAYYLTQWEEVRNYAIGQMTGTSGRQRVPTDSFRNLDVPVPPIEEQTAIAHILGTLDDKIELNRQMNETLEAMARALFKAWFVDFEPVRAKNVGAQFIAPVIAPASMDTRNPGAINRVPTQWPQHILDLFPNRLVESELGEIPEGWGPNPSATLRMLSVGARRRLIGPSTGRAEFTTGLHRKTFLGFRCLHCLILKETSLTRG